MTWSATDSQGKTIQTAWNGKASTGNAQITDTVNWKNPPEGNYRIIVSVSDGKCGKTQKAATSVLVQAAMIVSVTTDKKTYSPGETVLIKGSVKNEKGGIDGAAVVVNVEGTLLTATTDPFGDYTCPPFPIPSSSNPMIYKVIAKATYSGYPDKNQGTTFSVGKKKLLVKIRTDKKNYSIGEEVKCTITVTDSSGIDVQNADLEITATRLKSGKTPIGSSGVTDPSGKYSCTFPWGKKTAGKPIIEGKLKIEVKAENLGHSTWKGYDPGYDAILVSGCGDGVLQYSDQDKYYEDCFTCPEDCPCKPEEVCDPLNKLRNKQTNCSPKMAVIFTTNADPAYTWRHQYFAGNELKFIREKFKKKKYHIEEVKLSGKSTYLPKKKEYLWVPDANQIAKYLARPSTEAIAFFGHGGSLVDEAKGTNKPSLGGDNTANHLQTNVLNATSFNYQQLYKINAQEARKMAIQEGLLDPNWDCGLDYAYIHACHSLDDNSMRDFLVRNGGTYWGDVGILFGINPLEKRLKP